MYGVGSPYGFGWAAKGFTGDSKPYVPASLKIQPCAPPRPPLFCCDILQPSLPPLFFCNILQLLARARHAQRQKAGAAGGHVDCVGTDTGAGVLVVIQLQVCPL